MFENEKRVEDSVKGQKVLLDFEPIHAFSGIGVGAKYLRKGENYECRKLKNAWEVTFLESNYIVDFYSKGISKYNIQ